MKKSVVLFLVFALICFISCTPKVNVEVEKVEVQKVIDKYIEAMQSQDLEGLAAIFSHDEEMISFGTDAGERIVGWSGMKDLMEKQFAATGKAEITVSDQVVKMNSTGNTAWFSEVTDWKMMAGEEEINLKGLRLTGVLENMEGAWKIVQLHFSAPVEGQAVEY